MDETWKWRIESAGSDDERLTLAYGYLRKRLKDGASFDPSPERRMELAHARRAAVDALVNIADQL